MIASSFPPVIGGAETYAAVIARGLAERGHEVTVATDVPRGGSAEGSFADPEGVAVHRFDGHLALLEDTSKIRWEQMTYGLLPELAACAEACRPELILTNSLDAAHLGKMLSLELDLPWAAAFHEHAPEEEPVGRGRLRFVYDVLRPSLVLAGSDLYAERARRWGDRASLRLVHHGVDTDSFAPGVDGSATRRAYGFRADDLVVVCAGRLKPRKGMRELVSALQSVHERERRARLLIVGSTSSASAGYAAALEEDVERLQLGDVVTIDREVTFDRMPSILAAADVVAQPSWEEGLGLSVLEAMSAGRPTVTTDVVGVREILAGEDVALVVPPKQPRPLAAALAALLASPDLRQRLGARGRRHVLARFSQDLMLKETEAALGLLVGGRSRRAVAGV
jgi:glycosyltransferase involved in cell wall biosynthesis